ncbi:MAG: hypothetical protein RSH78_02365, partial [Bacilli bacterium]
MTLLFLVAIVPCFIYYIMKGNKSLHMLQQNWYNEGNRYIRWMLQNKYKVLIDVDMFFIIFVTAMFFAKNATFVLFIVFYCILALMFLERKKKEQIKKPLAITKRVKRIIITEILLFIIPASIMAYFVNVENLWLFLTILGAFPYLSYIIVYIASTINKPLEKMIYNNFMKQAKKKLKEMSSLNVVGITGSYGKTSSKNILNDILNTSIEKFVLKEDFSVEIRKKDENIIEVYKNFAIAFLKKGGMETSKIYNFLSKSFNEKKFYDSKIDYGIITFNLSSMKPKIIKKSEKPDNLLKYVLASSTCFPAFQITKINETQYIDGGYYDNLPINTAISLGAEEIIAIDLDSIGIKRKLVDKTVKIIYITPRNDLGSFLIFDKTLSRRAMKYGYNDSMKTYNQLDGDCYTFKKSHIFE